MSNLFIPPLRPRVSRPARVTKEEQYDKLFSGEGMLQNFIKLLLLHPTDNACVAVQYTVIAHRSSLIQKEMSATSKFLGAKSFPLKPTENPYEKSYEHPMREPSQYPVTEVTAPYGADSAYEVIYTRDYSSVAQFASDRLEKQRRQQVVDKMRDEFDERTRKGEWFIGHLPSIPASNYYSSVSNMVELLRPYVVRCTNIVLPLSIIKRNDVGHANLILIKRDTATDRFVVERWDPWTGDIRDSLDADLARFFKLVFSSLGYQADYLPLTSVCPTRFNFQAYIENDLAPRIKACELLSRLSPGGLCALWTFLYVLMRIYKPNQNASPQVVNRRLREWAQVDPVGFCTYAHGLAAELISTVKE